MRFLDRHNKCSMDNKRSPKSSGSNSASSGGIWFQVASITVFALSVFFLAALLTYQPNDPSWFSQNGAKAVNACGRAGAFVSAMLFQVLGLAAFLVPAGTFFLSANLHRREGFVRFAGTSSGMIVAVAALTVFLSLQWKYWPYAGTLLLTGGAIGASLAENLLREFNHLGASLLSLLVFALAIVFSTPINVARAGAVALSWLGRYAWKFGRAGITYAMYLGGLVAMRTAHALGDFLQRMIEGAISRARSKAKALAEMKKELEDRPVIGVQATAETEAVAGEAEEEDLEEDKKPAIAIEAKTETKSSIRTGTDTETGLETAIDDREITIIPPEQKPIVPDDTVAIQVASKVANKLSRLRKRGNWKLPTVEFLNKPPKIESHIDKQKIYENARILEQKFADFGIQGEVGQVMPGPVITLYEFKPGPGVKVSKIAALADDLSMALSARSVRILAPLPGKSVVGIEIPSEVRETVYMRELIQHQDFSSSKNQIPVVMGKDIAGQVNVADLARMPHLLVAGQTGSGKSVFMNSLICSLFYRFTPDELRMILIDPKYIEFRAYQDTPHLLLPVVDDPRQAATALKWAVREMERRYRILAKVGARNLAGYNQKVEDQGADVIRDLLLAEENQEDGALPMQSQSGGDWIEAFEPDETGAPKVGKLPYVMVIIDELADLMMIAKKEVEISIARIAQKARAAGIHLVIATQRPSTDVITGLIKANLPSRASFQLAAYVDSNTILNRGGAERLLGQGDMLFIAPGTSEVTRLHGAYLSDEEIERITLFLKEQGKPFYRNEILQEEESESADGEDDDRDQLWDQAIDLVKKNGQASASFLQRHLKVGYNRAARMIEDMEAQGIVGPADGARPREVLIRQ